MADPQKLAALQELATTGSFSTAQNQLGQSKDEALGRQSSLGGLIGAPGAATASTLPTVEAPYGRFNQALQEYQGAYDQSASTLGAANDLYFSQVADAQAAHRAEANRAIAEAQAAANRRSGSAGGYGDLSQWEIEARAGGLGDVYQQDATREAGENAETGSKIEAGVTGAQHAINQANLDAATEDERIRAAAQWDAEHPDVQVINNPDAMAEKNQWIDEWAGSDRLGGSRTERQAALDATGAKRDSLTEDPYQGFLSSVFDQRRQELEDYQGPEFKRQAAMDLQLLGPDIPPELAELQFRGMFPDLSPEDEMAAAEAKRKRDYYEQTGFESPQDQRSWEEAERKRAGEPDPNSTKVRRPDDPDVMRQAGLTPEEVDHIMSTDTWETALTDTENLLAGDEEEGRAPVKSIAKLRATLAELYDDEQMEKLIVAMYAPSMVG